MKQRKAMIPRRNQESKKKLGNQEKANKKTVSNLKKYAQTPSILLQLFLVDSIQHHFIPLLPTPSTPTRTE
jgi:hypothetical protein